MYNAQMGRAPRFTFCPHCQDAITGREWRYHKQWCVAPPDLFPSEPLGRDPLLRPAGYFAAQVRFTSRPRRRARILPVERPHVQLALF